MIGQLRSLTTTPLIGIKTISGMTICLVIQKVSTYHGKIYRMLLAIILYRVYIRKISAFCPLGVDCKENVGIMNSYTAGLSVGA